VRRVSVRGEERARKERVTRRRALERVRVRESVRENEGRRTSRTSLSTMTLTSAILFHRMVEWRVFAVSGSFAVSVTNGGENA
jgi:hypothetical protein